MAEKATIYKANLSIADVERSFYGDFNLTIALHPSETHERMMARLLAFAFCAHEHLSFAGSLSTADEPDLWLKHLDGRILEWIEVGQPSVDRLKKASSQSAQVKLFSYGRGLDIWWKGNALAIQSLPKVSAFYFDAQELQALTQIVQKTMNISVSISESSAFVATDTFQSSIELRTMDALIN